MRSAVDKASAVATRLLDALVLRNPERTAVGGMLGLSLYGLFGILRPLLAQEGVSLGEIDWWVSMCFGVVIVHLPFVVWSVRRRPLISDELESLMELIESTNIGEAEKRSSYRKVVNKCIEEFSLSMPRGTIRHLLVKEVEGASVKGSEPSSDTSA